jgi:hypothetical protein
MEIELDGPRHSLAGMEAKLPMHLTKKVTTALVFAIAMTVSSFASEIMVDDFRHSPEQNWRFFADTVMGGKSSGQVVFKKEGEDAYARMTGRVTTANNGRFIQIRKDLRSPPPEGTKGVRLIVRGNGERYFVHLRTSGTLLPWQYYQADFSTTASWREVRLPFERFTRSGSFLRQTPTPASLKSVGIVAFGRDHQAEIEVRQVGFY